MEQPREFPQDVKGTRFWLTSVRSRRFWLFAFTELRWRDRGGRFIAAGSLGLVVGVWIDFVTNSQPVILNSWVGFAAIGLYAVIWSFVLVSIIVRLIVKYRNRTSPPGVIRDWFDWLGLCVPTAYQEDWFGDVQEKRSQLKSEGQPQWKIEVVTLANVVCLLIALVKDAVVKVVVGAFK